MTLCHMQTAPFCYLGHEEDSWDPFLKESFRLSDKYDIYSCATLQLHIYQWGNILSAYAVKVLTVLVG